MKATHRIVIIGAGRLGRSVSAMLSTKNIPHLLLKRARPIPEADIYYLCVPDNQIGLLSKSVPRTGSCLHAAGRHNESIIEHPSRGVLHPIMSFPGPEISLPTNAIPSTFCGDTSARKPALWLAEQLGFTVYDVSGDRRLYHAAAVIAGNYASTLLRMAGTLLAECGVTDPHQALFPLALQSLENAVHSPLPNVLTGPIARGDIETIEAHQAAIEEVSPHIRTAYDALLEATHQQLREEEKKHQSKS